MQNTIKDTGLPGMCPGISGILILQHSGMFAEKEGYLFEKIRTLPLDVFYISQLSEKYKGDTMGFLKGILKASVFAILAFLRKERCSSVIYILRKSL